MNDESPVAIKEWMKLMVSPSKTLPRSPSSSPYLCSTARFVQSVDYHADLLNSGNFTFIMSPNPLAALSVAGADTLFPSSGSGVTLSVRHSISNVSGNYKGWYSTAGIASSRNSDAQCYARTIDIGNGLVFPIHTASGTTLTITANRLVNQTTFVIVAFFDNSTNANISASNALTQNPSYTVPAGVNLIGVGFYETLNGQTYSSHVGSYINISCATGVLVYPAANILLPLIRSELMEEGRVETLKCSGMEMLVTNMAPPLSAGGEIVIGRVNEQVILSATTDLATTIKQLPEQLYWRSGSVQDGAHAWWLPDDVESYEPHPVSYDYSEENVLIATGRTTAEGFLRVLCTWTFEFYSPRQIFTRDYSPTLTDEYRLAWKGLTQQPAVSSNVGHVALANAILSSVGSYLVQWLSKPQNQVMLKNLVKKQFAAQASQSSKSKLNQQKQQQQKQNNAQKQTKQTGAQEGTTAVDLKVSKKKP